MQKTVFIFVLLAVVAFAVADEAQKQPEMPKAFDVVNHRVARQLPIKIPGMEEMKAMGQEMIGKLPPQVQEYANKAQEMAQKMIPGK